MNPNQFDSPCRHELPWGVPLLLALSTVVLVGIVGSAAYSYQKQMVTKRTLEHLKGQSYVKRGLIRSWFLECEATMKKLAADPRLDAIVSNPLGWGGASAAKRRDAKAALYDVVRRHGFLAASLMDGWGNRLPGTEVAAAAELLPTVVRFNQPAEGSLLSVAFRPGLTQDMHVEVQLPLGASGTDVPPLFAVFALNPWKTLFPGLPIPDSYMASTETLLLQREGDQVIVANPTQCTFHRPLSIRLPFGPQGMATEALQGLVTQGNDHDYRGEAVLYATQYVPGAGWGIAVKADQQDAYATMKVTAFLVWGLVLVSFLTIGNLTYVWWSRRHKALLEEFSALGLRYRHLVESAHEGIWVWDSAGRTIYANGRLAQMLGFTQEELALRPVRDFFGSQGGEQAPFLMTPTPPSQGETHEVCLKRADGSDLWVMLSFSNLMGPQGDSRRSLGLLTDITKRREIENERIDLLHTLDRKKADLQRLLKELLDTQENERRNLSHELHDEIVQLLTAADSYLQGVENNLVPASLPSARAILNKARGQIGNAGARCRRLIFDLRPPDLERLGLVGALAHQLKASEIPRTQVIVTDEKNINALTREDQLVIFRVCQEALQNVRKHAKATEVKLSLATTPGEVQVCVRDNGHGFQPSAEANPGHFGLIGMRERVELAGGTLHIESNPGAGTSLEVHLPLVRGEVQLKLLKEEEMRPPDTDLEGSSI